MREIPAGILVEIDALVAQGAFPDRDAAIAALLRMGLDAYRSRGRAPYPRPPVPPGRREPSDDRPISVDPTDVNWAP